MFENLTDKLERSFKVLKGEGRITEINVAESLKEIRRALIDADVNYKVAKTFTDEVKAKALGQDVLRSVKPGQMMTKIVRDELAALMGGTMTDIRLEGSPAVVLIAGLQGSGKTTFSGKLANLIKSKKGRQVLLVAGDVYRPAAIDQLKVWAQRADTEIVCQSEGSDPAAVVFDAISAAKSRKADVVVCDTAGRLHNKKNLMDELAKINRVIDRELPGADKEVLLVLDATTGQNAVSQAREFKNTTGISGIILTKLDGTAKGGVVLAVKEELDIPVKFVGVGEQIDDLQPFDARDFAHALFAVSEE